MNRSDTGLTADDPPVRVGLLLIPGFGLLSYASAVEPMRAANLLSGRDLYRWTDLAPDGPVARASCGLGIPALPLANMPPLDLVLVIAGGNPARFRSAALARLLRRAARDGARLGGISGGPWVLARAGLLEGYRLTLHWEHAAAFAEEFPQADLRRSLFEIDRDRLTCAGGTAPLDLMHALIAARHGPQLAGAVAEWFLQPAARGGADPQRAGLRHRAGTSNRPVLRALAAMEGAAEQPLTRGQIAAAAGVGPRQLERLFRAHLGRSPGAEYLRLRLQRARGLLRQSDLGVTEIAVACGFASASHFARAYRRRFGLPPREERRSGAPPASAGSVGDPDPGDQAEAGRHQPPRRI